jgi:hypothetical protein
MYSVRAANDNGWCVVGKNAPTPFVYAIKVYMRNDYAEQDPSGSNKKEI